MRPHLFPEVVFYFSEGGEHLWANATYGPRVCVVIKIGPVSTRRLFFCSSDRHRTVTDEINSRYPTAVSLGPRFATYYLQIGLAQSDFLGSNQVCPRAARASQPVVRCCLTEGTTPAWCEILLTRHSQVRLHGSITTIHRAANLLF